MACYRSTVAAQEEGWEVEVVVVEEEEEEEEKVTSRVKTCASCSTSR